MKYTESKFKSKLVKVLQDTFPQAVIFRHEDRFTSGIPDISITINKYTIWIEIKFANPYLKKSKKIQTWTAQQLEKEGHCFYVIYVKKDEDLETRIVQPCYIEEWKKRSIPTEGIDHTRVVNYISGVIS